MATFSISSNEYFQLIFNIVTVSTLFSNTLIVIQNICHVSQTLINPLYLLHRPHPPARLPRRSQNRSCKECYQLVLQVVTERNIIIIMKREKVSAFCVFDCLLLFVFVIWLSFDQLCEKQYACCH